MITSKNGVDLIKRFEGLKLEAYLCPAKVWTIGYGTTENIKEGDIITESQAEQLLIKDLARFEIQLNRAMCGYMLTQNQFDALISFLYNVGIGNFKVSTLLRKILMGAENEKIGNEFKRWVYADGKKLDGLIRRRKAEQELFDK